MTPPHYPWPYLAVSVGVLFEVLLFAYDSFTDDMVVLDTHGGGEGSLVSLCQPRNLLGLLKVLAIIIGT